MPKRKVIEDSDDEDNAEITPPRQPAVTPSETNPGTPVDTEQPLGDVQQSVEPSTGSTELLKHQIRAAHQSLIDPTPNGSVSTKPVSSSQRKSQPSPSMSGSRLKRAKTYVDKPRAKKPLKKYGTESNKDIFEFYGDSDGELQGASRKDMSPRDLASSWDLSTGQTVALEDADPSSVRLGTNNKSAMSSMAPPRSKYTPQVQASETGMVAPTTNSKRMKSTPARPDATEGRGSFETSSSASRMPDPTMSSRGQGDAEYAPDTSATETMGNSPGLNVDAAALEPTELTSSPSSLSPSKIITVESRDRGTDSFDGDGRIEDRGSTKPVVVIPNMSNGQEGTDELSLPSHGPETWSINQTTLSKARKRKNEDSQENEAGSDDAAISLPKDQYQPRPSRSRSGQGTEEIIVPADFSKRPETVLRKKRKAKRSKTTAFHEFRPKKEEDGDEDSIVYKPVMEAIEPIPARASKKGKASEMTEQTATHNPNEDMQPDPEPAAKTNEKKKSRGRPKKGAADASENRIREDIDPEREDMNPEREDIDPDVLQVNSELEENRDPAPAVKMNRGTKAKQAPNAISEELVHDSDDELGDPAKSARHTSPILYETQASSKTPKLTANAAKITASTPANAIETPPQTPRKAGTPTQKGPDKHSPISSSAVAYRVGLSKRARIAPLLRIVRKA